MENLSKKEASIDQVRGGHQFGFGINFRFRFGSSPKFKKSVRFLEKIKIKPEPIVRFGSVSVCFGLASVFRFGFGFSVIVHLTDQINKSIFSVYLNLHTRPTIVNV